MRKKPKTQNPAQPQELAQPAPLLFPLGPTQSARPSSTPHLARDLASFLFPARLPRSPCSAQLQRKTSKPARTAACPRPR